MIGRGSFGTVYQAVWRAIPVAAKVVQLPESACPDAIREINTLA